MKKEFVFFCLTSGVWFDVYNESRNNADYYYGNDLKEPDEKTEKEWYFLESMALYQVQLIRMDSEQRVTQF